MARKGRGKSTSPASNVDGRRDDESQTPKIVEDINESDDEEIPEDYGCTEEEDAIAAMVMLNGNTNVHDKLFQEEAV